MNRIMIGAATAALLLAAASVSSAAPAKKPTASPAAAPASGAAAPAQPPLNHGPPLAGVCIYTDDRAVGTSTVGKAAATRMQQLRAQVAAELQAEQTAINTDATALNNQKATLPADQLESKAAPIRARYDALNAKAQQRQREIEATGADALQQIHQRVDGILRTIYQQRGCSLLLSGESVITANPAMDVTDQVVTQLNTVMPTISFDRKILPAQPQQ